MKLIYADILELVPNQSPRLSAPLLKLLTAKYERGAIPLSKISCDMHQAAKSAESLFTDFEEARMVIVEAFDDEDKAANEGVADDKKTNWRNDREKAEEFAEEFNALMMTEIELHLTPQPVTLIDQAKLDSWSGIEQARISWFFEQEEAEKADSNVASIAEHQERKEAAA